MTPQPPPGQGPIDPNGAFTPPPPPGAPGQAPSGWMPPTPGNFGPPLPPPQNMQPMQPMPYPPMMYPPPYKQERSFSKAIFLTLATTIFTVSLGLNLWLGMLLFVSGDGLGQKDSILVQGDNLQKVVVIPVSGIIMGDSQQKFERFLSLAEKDTSVKAIVVEIDTPGGDASASDQMYHRLMRFKETKKVPVVVSMGGMATSGGYYVAMGADHIFAQPTTLTGNIGVLAQRFNVAKMFDKWGIEETSLFSSGADFKNAGSMFKPEKAQDREYIQGLIDDIFTQFKQVVSTGRQGKLTRPIEEVADGRAFGAADAKSMGLIDDIGYLESAYAHAATLAKLTNPTVLRYEEPKGLAALLGASAGIDRATDARGTSVNVNGMNLRIDPAKIQEMLAPRPMFLWRGE